MCQSGVLNICGYDVSISEHAASFAFPLRRWFSFIFFVVLI